MRLEQWRPCDGSCCRAMPLRDAGGDCHFRDPSQPERGCLLMRHHARLRELSDRERAFFILACEGWPQNTDPETQAFDDSCCWRWADAD